MTAVLHANDDTFAAMLEAEERLVLVDFSASWCLPCKALEPVLEAYAQANPDVLVVKLDIEEAEETARVFRIRSVPTLHLVKAGTLLATQHGNCSMPVLERFVRENRR